MPTTSDVPFDLDVRLTAQQEAGQRVLDALREAHAVVVGARGENRRACELGEFEFGPFALDDAVLIAQAVVRVAEELPEILAGLSTAYGREEQLLPIRSATLAARSAEQLVAAATVAMRDLDPIYGPHGRKQDERAARPTAKG